MNTRERVTLKRNCKRISVNEWHELCEDVDHINCVLPACNFKELLEVNLKFFQSDFDFIYDGRPRSRAVCKEMLHHLQKSVMASLFSSIPYREKCRIIQTVDYISEIIYENPTYTNVTCQCLLFNAYLGGKWYSDAFHRLRKYPLNFNENRYRRETHGV